MVAWVDDHVMLPVSGSFRLDYEGSDLVYGRGCIDQLREILAEHGQERALVVCGSNVGANEALMGPVRAALGDRLAGVFDETTPAKSVRTVYDGIDAMREFEADVLVGVGGGSSLDVARQTSVFAADGRSLDDLLAAARDDDVDPIGPNGPPTPVVVVPTTFAGADVSSGGSIEVLSADESPTDQPVRVKGSVMPQAVVHDPALFETTPLGALEGSAMNGFDKGLETIYSKGPTAVTDATAVHGLRQLADAFPRLSANDPDVMARAVQGILLVQFHRRTSVVHAFGHGFARRYPVQQGDVHAVLIPHVLRYVLENVDGRRRLLAEGLGVDPDEGGDQTEAIVDAVVAVRDSLDVPTRLRDLDPVEEDDLPAIARFIVDDPTLEEAPEGLDPTTAEVEAVLGAAW